MIIKERVGQLVRSTELPEGDYLGQITNTRIGGDWEIADARILKADDDELIGKRASIFTVNTKTGDRTGLGMVLASNKLEELPEDDDGKQDSMTSIIGLKVPFKVVRKLSRQGQERSFINVIIDREWLAEQQAQAKDGYEAAKPRRPATKKRR